MKKDKISLSLIGLIALVLTTAAFLFPLAPGLVETVQGEGYMGYNFVFSNTAQGVVDAYGGMIAAFVLMVIGAFFQVLGFIFGFGASGKQFAGFMHMIGGVSMVASGVLYFLGKLLTSGFMPNTTSGVNIVLGYGFIAAGACAVVSGLLSVVFGYRAFASK
jgi:hypothetical protein